MSLLQRILEMVDEDNEQNVDFVDRQNQKKAPNVDLVDQGKSRNNPNSTKSTKNGVLKINTLENSSQNVDLVACMREVENHLPSSSSYEHRKNNISYARASDKVDKMQIADCDHCPAAGYWDYAGPGKWCFHRAYFLGKSGQPVHCDSAQRNCPLTRKKLQNAG